MAEPPTAALAAGEGLVALARFAAAIDAATLPPGIVRKAQACLLYALAVGVAAAEAKSAQIAADALDAEGETKGRATRLLDGQCRPPGGAAFANAVLMHARTQEDAHPAGHVGVVIVPAALAVGEHVGASGRELLAAIVAGYEVALRIGRDHVTDASARGLRSTPLYGVFGAAAAAGRLLCLDPQTMTNALALAANAAGGLREFVEAGTEEFAFHAGTAARNGIAAAFLAQAGVVAAPTSLDGRAGFFRALGEANARYADRLADGLGSAFEMEDVTYKPYPTCQFHRSVIRGVLLLRAQAAGGALASMRIHMHPFEADFFGVRYRGPFRSFAQTFMSAPFCAALAWNAGAVTYRGMHAFDEATVTHDVHRIEVIADPECPRYMPRIALRLTDGREHAWKERAGAGEFRLTWDTAVAMTHTLAQEARVPNEAAAQLMAAVEGLPRHDSVSGVVSACRAAIVAGNARHPDRSDSPAEEVAK